MSPFSYRTPPLEAIRGFVAVARRMSITLAAQDLFLTQSAVSRQIQALEDHFGTPLFLRRHRAIELTAVGEQLFQLASPWLDSLVAFSEVTRRDGLARPVTITANVGVVSLWILPRLGAFQAQHPNVNVRIAATNQVLDFKQEGIDLAIRYCREAAAPQGATRLFGEEVVPVASRAVAERAFKPGANLLDEVFLELDQRARPWLRWAEWLEDTEQAGARPRTYLHFNQYDQLIQAAIEGHGVALGRLSLVQPMLDDGRLVAQWDRPPCTSDFAYWLVLTPGPVRPEVQVLADWIVAQVRAGEKRLADIHRPRPGLPGR